MITGDNPLTACHVAKELKFVKKEALIYYPPDEVDDEYHWAVSWSVSVRGLPNGLCYVLNSMI